MEKLIAFRDNARSFGVTGFLLLDGSFVSSKPEPRDFDIILVAQPNIQALKDMTPGLAHLLDAERAEKEGRYSLFYTTPNSPTLDLVCSMFDRPKEGGPSKGLLEVEL